MVDLLIRQRLTVSLSVFLLCSVGLFVAINTSREVFPNVNLDMMTIQTIYTGASPEDTEQLITIPIEKKLRSVNGIDKVRSYNIEHVSVIVVFMDPDARNKPRIVQDIKDAVESVDNLPEAAERPVVTEIVTDKFPVMNVAMTLEGDDEESYRRLRKAAWNLERELFEIDGIADVERMGYRDREFLVEVPPEKLAGAGIGINTVLDALMMRNMDMPGGVLRLGRNEILLRTLGKFRSTEDVSRTVIRANDLGYALTVGDIAEVSDTFAEPEILERFNNRNAIILSVLQKQGRDLITMSEKIQDVLDRFRAGEGREFGIFSFNDSSRFVRSRLSALGTNAVVGFVLLVLILFFILGTRMSLLVSIAFPVTVMGAAIGMRLAGISLNVVSMFALVMALGMIVDFAIVVAENSYRHVEKGRGPLEAVRAGVSEVFWPVTVTFVCISAAFAPLLFLTGLIGKVVWIIPLMIMICLSASWFAAMFILPTYLAAFARPSGMKGARAAQRGAFVAFREKYRQFLSFCLKRRYATVGVLTAVLLLSVVLGMVAVGFVFFPGGGGENIIVRMKMPRGTPLAVTSAEADGVERLVAKLPGDELDSRQMRVGTGYTHVIDPAPSQASYRATLILNLTPEGDRERTADEIIAELRERLAAARRKGEVEQEFEVDFEALEGGPPVGLPVNVELRGADMGTLNVMAGEYRDYLESIDGVHDVTIDLEGGKDEYRYRVDEAKAKRAGLSVGDIARALYAAFGGTEATTVTLGDDEVAVRVRFPEEYRHREDSLNKVVMANQMGGLVQVSDIAGFKSYPGYSMINRLNYRRVVQVKANIDVKKTTSVVVNRQLKKKFADITERYPGYLVNYGGEDEDMRKSMENLVFLFVLALAVIFCILAVFFDSLAVPLVVMSAVPFAFVGVVIALITHVSPMSFMGFLGFVSLTGVVVSNTLVLVQFIYYQIAEGRPLNEALVAAGVMRLRPVLLTSGTTVLALLPTIYGIGGADPFVAPLALAFGYGLVLATFVTLILIPCLYHISEDLKGVAGRWFGKLLLWSGKLLLRLRRRAGI